jgi:uncharacterized protein
MGRRDDVRIQHNEAERRYELFVGDDLVSIADYRLSDGVFVFDHTETAMVHRGKGLADELVRFALDDVRANGRRIVPLCWFVADFVNEHPEYRDLIADRRAS